MTVDVAVTRTIAAPIERVASYAADPSNAPAWYRRIRSARWVSAPDVEVGSRIEFEARFIGRTLRYTYEIVDHVPGERLTMTTAQGPFPMTTEYTWIWVDGASTRMTLRNHGTPSGFSRWMAPLMSRAMRRAMTGDLACLAEVLEDR